MTDIEGNVRNTEERESFSIKRKIVSNKQGIFYYFSMLFVGLVIVTSMYVDYICDNNMIVPKDYIYVPKQNNNDVIDIKRRSTILTNNTDENYECVDDTDCGDHGTCEPITDIYGNLMGSKCDCDKEYLTVNDDICNYHMLNGLTALLLSIFLGELGVDRCYLARGQGVGCCVGVVKGITLGGIGIWWIVDIALIASGELNDSRGHPLSEI